MLVVEYEDAWGEEMREQLHGESGPSEVSGGKASGARPLIRAREVMAMGVSARQLQDLREGGLLDVVRTRPGSRCLYHRVQVEVVLGVKHSGFRVQGSGAEGRDE